MASDGPTRAALIALAMLASILANIVLLSMLFVWRPEYTVQIREVNDRLDRIEHRLGIYAPDPRKTEP